MLQNHKRYWDGILIQNLSPMTPCKKGWLFFGVNNDIIYYLFFFLDSRKPHPPESALCRPRWASKTLAVPDSYKRCTSWLELETCYADLKPFAITLRPLNPTILFIITKIVERNSWKKKYYCMIKFIHISFWYKTMFVSWKVVSGKPLSKLSCVCLPLEKLVNGKHFPVKEKFGLVFKKVFSWKIWAKNTFRKLWKI